MAFLTSRSVTFWFLVFTDHRARNDVEICCPYYLCRSSVTDVVPMLHNMPWKSLFMSAWRSSCDWCLCVKGKLLHLKKLFAQRRQISIRIQHFTPISICTSARAPVGPQVIGHAEIWLAHLNNIISRKPPESSPMLPDGFSVAFS